MAQSIFTFVAKFPKLNVSVSYDLDGYFSDTIYYGIYKTTKVGFNLIDTTNNNENILNFNGPPSTGYYAETYDAVVNLIQNHIYRADITSETNDGYANVNFNLSAVPLPSAVILLGAGLGRLGLYYRRKRKANN